MSLNSTYLSATDMSDLRRKLREKCREGLLRSHYKVREYLTELYFLQQIDQKQDYSQFYSWKKAPAKPTSLMKFINENDFCLRKMRENNNIRSTTTVSMMLKDGKSDKKCETMLVLSDDESSEDIVMLSSPNHANRENGAAATSGDESALDVLTDSDINVWEKEDLVLARVAFLKEHGLWSEVEIEKGDEPGRPRSHWDNLLEEMQWMANDFQRERRLKQVVARKVAKMVAKEIEERVQTPERSERDLLREQKRIASVLAKQIREFWCNIEKLVLHKEKCKVEEKRRRALDMHLNYIVGQTEQYSQWLAHDLKGIDGQKAAATGAEAAMNTDNDLEIIKNDDAAEEEFCSELADLKAEGELSLDDLLDQLPAELVQLYGFGNAAEKLTEQKPDEFDSDDEDDADSSDNDEEESSADESNASSDEDDNGMPESVVEDHTGDINSLLSSMILEIEQKADNPDFIVRDVLLKLVDDVLLAVDRSKHPMKTRQSARLRNHVVNDSVTESPAHLAPLSPPRLPRDSDGEFVSPSDSESDDESTIAKEEHLASDHSHDDELNLLADEAELSLDELRSRYSMLDHMDSVSNGNESDSSSLASESQSSASEVNSATEGIKALVDTNEDKKLDVHELNNSTVNDTNDKPTAVNGIDLSARQSANEGQKSSDKQSQENADDGLAASSLQDIARQAESFQPTGWTLETTQVHTTVPHLLRHKLREYQVVGLDWLATMYEKKLNGILADEMGLGKTMQTIALLAHMACDHSNWGPHLIVVPTSVMLNWEIEFKKWCPGFKILTYFGSQKERREKRRGWTKPNAFHVCITSYTLAVQDSRVFKQKRWKYFILDEAQHIKNFKSQRWQTLLNLNSQRRLLLTGTPLQNSLMELWSLMHFLMPHVFQSHIEFKEWFANPLTGMIEGSQEYNEQLVMRLHKVLRPFLLRRLKQDVEKQMPKKFEHVVLCRLSKRQRYLYDDFMSQRNTRDTLSQGNYMSVLGILMQLRKVCNHPNLFDPRPVITPFACDPIVYTTASLVNTCFDPHPLRNLTYWRDIEPPLVAQDPASQLAVLRTRNLRSSEADVEVFVTQSPAERDYLLKTGRTMRKTVKAKVDANADATDDSSESNGVVCSLQYNPLEFRHAKLQQRRDTARLETVSRVLRINTYRFDHIREPVYSSELLKCLRIDVDKLMPEKIHWRKARRCASEVCRSAAECYKTLDQCIARFCIYIPPVLTTLPTLRFLWLAPHQLVVDKLRRERFVASLNSFRPTYLHRIATLQTIQFPEARLIEYDCGKLQTLNLLLQRLLTEGHRTLIFTQMTKMLDVLEQFLSYHGYPYLRLDGSTKIEHRQILMDRFNADSRLLCFILSTRSGGLGINLTGADTVIFYDSDWNPTMDAQAQDRCHRIGQTRDVHIYRLISERTVEENILKKANQKRLLGDVVIEGGNFTTAFFRQHTIQELFSEPTGLQEEVNGAPTNETTTPNVNDNVLEDALCEAEKGEDERDVMAAKEAKAEEKADLAEFDEAVPMDSNAHGENDAASAEKEAPAEIASQADENFALLTKQLLPVERFAVKMMENAMAPEILERLRQADEEINASKGEFELQRMKSFTEQQELEADADLDDMLFVTETKAARMNALRKQLKRQKMSAAKIGRESSRLKIKAERSALTGESASEAESSALEEMKSPSIPKPPPIVPKPSSPESKKQRSISKTPKAPKSGKNSDTSDTSDSRSNSPILARQLAKLQKALKKSRPVLPKPVPKTKRVELTPPSSPVKMVHFTSSGRTVKRKKSLLAPEQVHRPPAFKISKKSLVKGSSPLTVPVRFNPGKTSNELSNSLPNDFSDTKLMFPDEPLKPRFNRPKLKKPAKPQNTLLSSTSTGGIDNGILTTHSDIRQRNVFDDLSPLTVPTPVPRIPVTPPHHRLSQPNSIVNSNNTSPVLSSVILNQSPSPRTVLLSNTLNVVSSNSVQPRPPVVNLFGVQQPPAIVSPVANNFVVQNIVSVPSPPQSSPNRVLLFSPTSVAYQPVFVASTGASRPAQPVPLQSLPGISLVSSHQPTATAGSNLIANSTCSLLGRPPSLLPVSQPQAITVPVRHAENYYGQKITLSRFASPQAQTVLRPNKPVQQQTPTAKKIVCFPSARPQKTPEKLSAFSTSTPPTIHHDYTTKPPATKTVYFNDIDKRKPMATKVVTLAANRLTNETSRQRVTVPPNRQSSSAVDFSDGFEIVADQPLDADIEIIEET